MRMTWPAVPSGEQVKIIKEHYAKHVRDEWKRLDTGAFHRLEFLTTMHFLKKVFPKRGLILDAGGGPGRYTVALAGLGYDVVLVDFVERNLTFAKRQVRKAGLQARLAGAINADITDLSCFPSNHFDGVVCLGGPLSHLLKRDDRKNAIGELARVAKPGAPVLISVMSKLSTVINEAATPRYQRELTMPFFSRYVRTGDYSGKAGFTAFHGFMRDELCGLATRHGLAVLQIAGLEGAGQWAKDAFDRLERNDERWNVWLKTHYAICTEPSIADLSAHMLAVCRKPNRRA